MNPTRRCRLSRDRAFSLIELLVVIGLVMVLVGLLLPALARTRGSALSTRSLVAMQQAAAVMQQYCEDYDGVYPFSGDEHAPLAAIEFHRPLKSGGYISGMRDIDPDAGRLTGGRPNVSLSTCLVYDPLLMRPGYTEPNGDKVARPVRVAEVLFPSSKGSLFVLIARDGRIQSPWCCIDGSPPGPVAFCDGSAGSFYWRDLLTEGLPELDENGVGAPVDTTWFGCRGRDR